MAYVGSIQAFWKLDLFGPVKRQDVRAVEQALKKNARVDSQDIFGMTPLMYAIIKENPDIVKLLIDYHADVNLQDKSGNTHP